MEPKGELIPETSILVGVDGPDGKAMMPIQDPLRKWADIVEQDSQAETFEYLGESVAKHSGE
jgi:hypothetical protein